MGLQTKAQITVTYISENIEISNLILFKDFKNAV